MSGPVSTSEIIERLVARSGVKKKLAAEVLHAIPEIIEEGLKRDGEAKVRGLGTFRMKWTQTRIGRNPKTGVTVEIPPHYRLVFLPEQSLKDYLNQDYRLLTYQVIPVAEPAIPEPIILTPSWPEPVPEPEPYVVAGIGSDEEPGPAERRRRLHWIIPVAISVIVILAGIFYMRNCRKEPVGGQDSAVGSQRSAVSGQKEDTIQHSTFNTQHPTFITTGLHLFQISRDVYDGNPYLWALIYKANRDIITNPQNVPKGLELVIPGLEGTPHKLSHNDSLEVSEGYRLLSDYYREKDGALSEGLLRTSRQFTPK